jgi:hypothetical protein
LERLKVLVVASHTTPPVAANQSTRAPVDEISLLSTRSNTFYLSPRNPPSPPRPCQDPREIRSVTIFKLIDRFLFSFSLSLCDLVSLTKTKAKDRTSKTKYIETIRRALDEYAFVYLFSYDNMRSTLFKDIRMDWRESRIVLGKNSVTQIALGRTAEDEYKDNLRYISQRIDGNVGLLFTNRSREETER